MIGEHGKMHEGRTAAVDRLREALESLSRHHPDLFYELFWRGSEVRPQLCLSTLEAQGFVVQSSNGLRAAVQIWSGEGIFIVTDRPDYRPLDRVFPIFSDESLFLGRCAVPTKSKWALDVGTGSGILAVQAARSGAKVVGVDINQRALRMARLNSALNGLSDEVQFIRGDTLQAVRPHDGFDLIVANPPFVPLPPHCPFHVAGDGGVDGTQVIRKILQGAGAALSRDGALVMSALSLEREGRPYVQELASQLLPPTVETMRISIYGGSVSLEEFCAVFNRWDTNHSWTRHLERRGFDSVGYYVFVAARDEVRQRLEGIGPEPPEVTVFSGTWAGRFGRYEYWLARTGV
jgi:methylase of polypeptide subunit release factors